MNRIDAAFAQLRSRGRRALIPFVCGGHPAPGVTAAVLPALERAGASVIEVGIPFSDPIADGPVIAAAMHDALARGSKPQSVFAEVASARDRISCGLVAMCSVSIVLRLGASAGGVSTPERGFARLARAAGFDGLIVPDAPYEVSSDLIAACNDAGLTLSLLIAPTTPEERAARIARACTGFVYLLARAGITGESSGPPNIAGRVASLRRATPLPIACGFGIATPEHVRAVVGPPPAGDADAAIVGSALVRAMSTAHAEGRDAAAAAESIMRELGSGLEPGVASPRADPR